MTGYDEVKKKDSVMVSGWGISRETSGLAYIRDSERVRKIEIAYNRISLEWD